MSDGARKARLNEKRTDCSGVGFTITAVRGEKFGSSSTLNLSSARADHPAQVVGDEDLVLDVDAALRAVVAARRQAEVELVVAEVAAVAQHVAGAERVDVAVLDVERLGVELEEDRLSVESHRQQRVGVAVEDVGEEVDLLRALGPARRAVAEHRAAVHVERADAGVDDALGAGEAGRERQAVGAFGGFVVDPGIELRLARAAVGKGRVRGVRRVVDRAFGPRHRVLREPARRDLVRPAVVGRCRVGAVHVPERSVAPAVVVDLAAEGADAHREAACRPARAGSW